MENISMNWGPECCGLAMHDEGHPGAWECGKCHRTLTKDVDDYHATVSEPTTLTRAWAVPTRNGRYEKILGIVDDAEVTLRGRTAAGRYKVVALHSKPANGSAKAGTINARVTMHSRRDLVKPSCWCRDDRVLAVVEIER